MTTLIVICCLIYIAKNIDENKVTDIFTLLWYLFLAIIHIPYFIIEGIYKFFKELFEGSDEELSEKITVLWAFIIAGLLVGFFCTGYKVFLILNLLLLIIPVLFFCGAICYGIYLATKETKADKRSVKNKGTINKGD